MKNLNVLFFGVLGGLIVSEIIRAYEPFVTYIIYACIIMLISINFIIYWRNRIKVKITKQHLTDYAVAFTATNMGNYRNSLDSKVILQCLDIPLSATYPIGTKHKYIFHIEGNSNILEPHETKNFRATTKEKIPESYFTNFRRYRIIPNRGMYIHIYFTGVAGEAVPFWKFYPKRFLYRFFKIGLVYKSERHT